MTHDELKEAEANALAIFLIDLAFLVPIGTNFHTHPIAKSLTKYVEAVRATARDSNGTK